MEKWLLDFYEADQLVTRLQSRLFGARQDEGTYLEVRCSVCLITKAIVYTEDVSTITSVRADPEADAGESLARSRYLQQRTRLFSIQCKWAE